jgi:hypothetical protein
MSNTLTTFSMSGRLLLSYCLQGKLGLVALPHLAAQNIKIAVAGDRGSLFLGTPGLDQADRCRRPCGT